MVSTQSSLSVLVVDDNISTCRTLVRLLERSGYSARCAESGLDALATLEASRPRVVFLDVMMPGVDGFDVLRAIRADSENAPVAVIMYSAMSNPDYMKRAMELGANGYVVKGDLTFAEIEGIIDENLKRLN
ncbi:MAG: hypothetical protein JWO87_2581 [Phycisphaerales bacterium]|jgi:CheY-like chemotaxis protein|nr:hypothetical protein [Phycisphaerales bacterium]MDB5300918.1 hypothetical protein [Phycisphaerales bacterium]MDB5303289.1 hypothetical protein [Phycisphaerales bacterium]